MSEISDLLGLTLSEVVGGEGSEDFAAHLGWYREQVENGTDPEKLYLSLMRQCDKLKEQFATLEKSLDNPDDRLEKMKAAYENTLQGHLQEARALRAGRHNWRTYDGKQDTLPKENIECVVWPEWKQSNGLLPVELNLYHENGGWITEEDERIDSVHVGDKWIPWEELWR